MAFKMAVVMPAFNTGKYISQALDSVINQSLDFKKNIQIIVVDDASTDNTRNVVESYARKYPDNITLIANESNRGPGYSRNRGLQEVDAEYVNFLDSDDYISKNAFKNAYYFLETNRDVDIASIPLYFFGVRKGPHKLNYKFEKTQIVNLLEKPDHIQLSGPSSFFRFSKLKNYSFSENLRVSEDPLLINQMLVDNPKIAFLKGDRYNYRKDYTQESLISTSTLNKSYFTTRVDEYFIRLLNYALQRTGHVPKFIQHVIMYDLQWILEIRYINNLLDAYEIEELYSKIIYLLKYIDEDVILSQLSLPIELKRHIILIKRHGSAYLRNKDSFQGYHGLDTVCIDHFEFLNEGELYISGIFTNFIKLTDIFVEVDGRQYPTKKLNFPQRKNYSLNFDYAYNHCFEVVLPVKPPMKISFRTKNSPLLVDYNHTSRLSRTSKYRKSKDYYAIDREKYIEVVKKDFIKGIRGELRVWKLILEERKQGWRTGIVLRVLYFIFYYFLKNRHIWVFMDLPNAAGDNGYYLFEYANAQESLKGIDMRYVFSKSQKLSSNLSQMHKKYLSGSYTDKIRKLTGFEHPNEEYQRIEKTGKVLSSMSIMHRLYLLFAEFIITSHPDNEIIYPFWGNYPHLAGLSKSKTVFLQHGVTKDNISHWLNRYDKRIDLIVTVSEKERQSFLSEEYGYEPNQIQVLGFPRFDRLERLEDKREIVLMPTWRRQYDSFKREEFIETDYFKSYNAIINDTDFKEYIKSLGYRLIFKPHRNVMKFIDAFDIPADVEVGSDISYTEIFNHSSLMITDYSSVAFDFAYLKKPLIYFHPRNDYHFDTSRSYFDYKTMGFGPVCESYDDFKSQIVQIVERGCEMEEKYASRVDEFFTFTDRNNSKRVIDAILELDEKFYY